MPYNYKKLRGRIIEIYGSQCKFAEVLNISENSLSKKLNCKSGFSQADIAKWSELLRIHSSQYGDYFFT
ncbi:MAG: DUF739 family protein [Lachnospiraceae bacterium]|nr:DUF739 family protein [Lachnospiraceae bacterium]